MNKKEYLSEEKYQKNVKKIRKISLTILLIGILIGGSIISLGVSKQLKINDKYSKESNDSLQEKLDSEKKKLEDKKNELEVNRENSLENERKNLESKKQSLEAKGVKYNSFATYNDGEIYDLYIITKVLDSSFDYCAFDEYKNNDLTKKYCSIYKNTDDDSKSLDVINKVLDSSVNYCSFDEYKNNTLTSKYCSLKNDLDDNTNDFNKSFDSSKCIPFYMFGAFIIVASCMISFSVYSFSKRREMMAFTTQQMNPIVKEQIESMGTSVGRAMANAAKEINPEYKSLKCPNCGASIDGTGEIEKCAYCGETLVKVGSFK